MRSFLFIFFNKKGLNIVQKCDKYDECEDIQGSAENGLNPNDVIKNSLVIYAINLIFFFFVIFGVSFSLKFFKKKVLN